jgi:hypothetical protein
MEIFELLSRIEDRWASVLLIQWTWILFSLSFLMKIILDILGYNIWNSIISKGFLFEKHVNIFVVFVPMKGVVLWSLYSNLKCWLYLFVLTIQAVQKITSIILITETVALLEYSVGLHISVCIIRRMSSISSL